MEEMTTDFGLCNDDEQNEGLVELYEGLKTQRQIRR